MTTTALPVPDTGEAVPRRARLERALTRVRGVSTGTDRLERWLLIGGGVLLPLGLLVIALGWFGASRTGRLFEQIPYMISGGMLGLGLVVAGGFLYFGYWLTRIVHESRSQADRAVEALERIEALLAGGAAAGVGNGHGNGRAASPRAGEPAVLLATATGNLVHRPDCAIVATRENVRQVNPGQAGFVPCKICNP